MYPAAYLMLAESPGILSIILPVAGSMLLCYGVFQIIVESRTVGAKKIEERLHGVKKTKADEKSVASILRRGSLQNTKTFAHSLLGKVSFLPRLQTLIDQADLEWLAVNMVLNLLAAAAVTAIGLILMDFGVLTAVACAVAVLFLPLAWLSHRRKARVVKLTAQLPDVFEMMSQALRAGHALGGAIHLIHEQMPNPISAEFGRVYHEQNLGLKLEDALASMADRIDSMDVKFFVTAVQIQRSTGGDLAEVLEKIGGVIRSRIELFGMVKGLTAEGRLSGYVLFALPIVTFIGSLYLNPEYANVLLDDPTGRIMLMVAAGMQLMGLAMIRWIVNIKV